MRAPERTFKRARQLRRALTLPEALLWRALRLKQLDGLRFRRQHPMGPFILDFYCPSAKLAVDGAVHDNPEQAAHDRHRGAWLSRRSIKILRFAAAEVLSEAKRHDVEATIMAKAATRIHASSPAQRGRGTAEGGGGGEHQSEIRRSTARRDPPPDIASRESSSSPSAAPSSAPSTVLRKVPLPRFAGEDLRSRAAEELKPETEGNAPLQHEVS